jgi:predicted transposase/invertase (TIGR01784 family)
MAATEIDPRVNCVFKRLFGVEDNAGLLVDLLNATLEPDYRPPVTGVEYRDTVTTSTDQDAKMSIFDVFAIDNPGRHFLLEMQRLIKQNLPGRFTHYACSVFVGQMNAGDPYMALQPVISLLFMEEDLFPEEKHWHLCFELRERTSGRRFTRALEFHVLQFSKFNLTAEEVKTPLERWMYFLKHGATLDPEKLPPSLDVPVIRQAMEVLMQFAKNKEDRFAYIIEARRLSEQATDEYYRREAIEQRETAIKELREAQQESLKIRQENLKIQQDSLKTQQALRDAQQENLKTQQAARDAVDSLRKEMARFNEQMAQMQERMLWIGKIQNSQELLNEPQLTLDQGNALSLEQLRTLYAEVHARLLAK